MRNHSIYDQLQLLYYRFKDTSYYHITVSLGIMVVCLLLVVSVILPQLQHWFSINNEIAATRDRIATIQQNMNFLSSLNSRTLNRNYETVQRALPLQNDFTGIMNSIALSAVKSGISLQSYDFEPGELGFTAQNGPAIQESKLTIAVNGDVLALEQFISELLQKLPLVSISSLTLQGTTGNLNLAFYYKRPPQIPLQETVPLPQLSSEENELIASLEEWQSASGFIETEASQDISEETESPF
jgi:Tfp pilus assembly protein PilO